MADLNDPVVVLKYKGDPDTGLPFILGVPAADLTDYEVAALVQRDPRWHAREVIESKVEEDDEGRKITRDVARPMTDKEFKNATEKFTEELLNSGLYTTATREGEAATRHDARAAGRVATRVADVPAPNEVSPPAPPGAPPDVPTSTEE
jgi:hypothetical protein